MTDGRVSAQTTDSLQCVRTVVCMCCKSPTNEDRAGAAGRQPSPRGAFLTVRDPSMVAPDAAVWEGEFMLAHENARVYEHVYVCVCLHMCVLVRL